MTFFSSNTAAIICAFFAFTFGMLAFVISLDSFWRAKGRLRMAILYLMVAIVPFIARKVELFFGYYTTDFINIVQYLDVAAMFFYFMAVREIYCIIKELDNEN